MTVFSTPVAGGAGHADDGLGPGRVVQVIVVHSEVYLLLLYALGPAHLPISL
jgi:hypothetical protein